MQDAEEEQEKQADDVCEEEMAAAVEADASWQERQQQLQPAGSLRAARDRVTSRPESAAEAAAVAAASAVGQDTAGALMRR
jgi:hypothetical protein